MRQDLVRPHDLAHFLEAFFAQGRLQHRKHRGPLLFVQVAHADAVPLEVEDVHGQIRPVPALFVVQIVRHFLQQVIVERIVQRFDRSDHFRRLVVVRSGAWVLCCLFVRNRVVSGSP